MSFAVAYPGFGRPCRATHLGLCRGRPYRALYYLRWFTQGLVALAGLRTLGFVGVAPIGALYYLLWLTQGLVALSGLRTLGFVGIAPIGAYPSCWSKAAAHSASASVLLGKPMPYSI